MSKSRVLLVFIAGVIAITMILVVGDRNIFEKNRSHKAVRIEKALYESRRATPLKATKRIKPLETPEPARDTDSEKNANNARDEARFRKAIPASTRPPAPRPALKFSLSKKQVETNIPPKPHVEVQIVASAEAVFEKPSAEPATVPVEREPEDEKEVNDGVDVPIGEKEIEITSTAELLVVEEETEISATEMVHFVADEKPSEETAVSAEPTTAESNAVEKPEYSEIELVGNASVTFKFDSIQPLETGYSEAAATDTHTEIPEITLSSSSQVIFEVKSDEREVQRDFDAEIAASGEAVVEKDVLPEQSVESAPQQSITESLPPDDTGYAEDVKETANEGENEIPVSTDARQSACFTEDTPEIDYINTAREAMAREDFVCAEKAFRAAALRAPLDTLSKRQFAKCLKENGKYVEAGQFYAWYLSLNEDDADAWIEYSETLLSGGSPGAALETIAKPLSFPELSGYHLDRIAGVLDLMEKAAEPASAEGIRNTRFVLGGMYFKLKIYEGAEKQFSQVLNSDPQHFESRISLAETHIRMGKEREALEAYRVIAAEFHDNYWIQRRYCEALAWNGDHDAAGAIAGDILSRDPGNLFMHRLLVKLLLAGGDERAARMHLVNLQFEHPELYPAIAESLADITGGGDTKPPDKEQLSFEPEPFEEFLQVAAEY